jgi:exodeoxyribonuclease VII large subunit
MRAPRLRPERRQSARELQSEAGIAEGSWFVNAESGRALPKVDVLIVGRGGGSVESLWSLNEEEVARAIFQSEIPLVSAVGYETYFTTADLVADHGAPTPSAAAELVVPDGVALAQQLSVQGGSSPQAPPVQARGVTGGL